MNRAGTAGQQAAAGQASTPSGGQARRRLRPVAAHLGLLSLYLAAGIRATWPRAAYLGQGRLPGVRDVASYVWDFWWVAHQLVHLGNPWFTGYMAAPVGMRLGFDTVMPLPGALMAPVTLAYGPAAAFTLATIVTPGLLCYVTYRAAALWLRQPGAIAAGALLGLSTMMGFQIWYHLNIALGMLFLPMTLEAVIRLRRSPGIRQGLALGLVLGASVLVNQETAVLAVILAAVALAPWLARGPGVARLRAAGVAAGLSALVASPQLAAMAQQAAAGGATAGQGDLAANYGEFGAALPGLFAPSPQVARYGLAHLASSYTYRQPAEAIATFGAVLTLLALCGLAARWRQRAAWQLALLWLGSAALALGPTLVISGRHHVPLVQDWHGTKVSPLMPYTWLVQVPGLSALREADRIALLGLVAAAILAGAAVDWVWQHALPAVVVVAALAALEAGYPGGIVQPGSTGYAAVRSMPAAMPGLDRAIAADHSGSIVLDIPFGLRGGIPVFGRQFATRALLLATADGHPRSVSYSSWVPGPTIAGIMSHPFYAQLLRAEHGTPVWPFTNVTSVRIARAHWLHAPLGFVHRPATIWPFLSGRSIQITPAQVAAARRDARAMYVGWALVWNKRYPGVVNYLEATGFRFAYKSGPVWVYRLAPRP